MRRLLILSVPCQSSRQQYAAGFPAGGFSLVLAYTRNYADTPLYLSIQTPLAQTGASCYNEKRAYYAPFSTRFSNGVLLRFRFGGAGPFRLAQRAPAGVRQAGRPNAGGSARRGAKH